MQGTRGREHVSHAEVRLISPTVSFGNRVLFTLDLASAEWQDFLISAEDRVRLPFFITIPWGLEFHRYENLVGKVIIRKNVRGTVGVEIQIVPPAPFRRAAEALSRTIGLAIDSWQVTEDGVGATARLIRTRASSAKLKSAVLQLQVEEETLLAYLRAEWPSGPAGLWNGRSAHRTSSFRFRIPQEADQQAEDFFRKELLPQLEQGPSGSLPIPAQTTGTVVDQLPRIVPEPQSDT